MVNYIFMSSLVKILDRTKIQDRTIFSGDTEVLNGWVNGVYYIEGVATELDSSGNGTWNGITYIAGVPQ